MNLQISTKDMEEQQSVITFLLLVGFNKLDKKRSWKNDVLEIIRRDRYQYVIIPGEKRVTASTDTSWNSGPIVTVEELPYLQILEEGNL